MHKIIWKTLIYIFRKSIVEVKINRKVYKNINYFLLYTILLLYNYIQLYILNYIYIIINILNYIY